MLCKPHRCNGLVSREWKVLEVVKLFLFLILYFALYCTIQRSLRLYFGKQFEWQTQMPQGFEYKLRRFI